MADDNVIDIVLRFLVDNGSQTDAEAAIKRLEQEGIKFNAAAGQFYDTSGKFISRSVVADIYKDITGGAGATAGAASQATVNVKQFMTELVRGMAEMGYTTQETRDYIATMNPALQKAGEDILADEQLMESFRATAVDTSGAIKNIDQNTQSVYRTLRSSGAIFASFMVGQLGTYMTKMGKTILDQPIQAYTKYAGLASGASADWLASQKELEQSAVRIGAVLTQQVAPVMRMIAGVASQTAGLLERNPWMGTAAAFAGSFLLAGGAILKTLSDVMMLMMAVRMSGGMSGILGALGIGGATTAGAAAGGTAAGTAAAAGGAAGLVALVAPIAGLVVALGATTAAIQMLRQHEIETGAYQERLTQIESLQAQGQHIYPGNLPVELRSSQIAVNAGQVDQLTSSIDKLGTSAQKTSGVLQSQATIDAYIAYQQAETQAAQTYEQERLTIVEQYGADRARAEQQYEQERAQIIQQYKDTMAQESADFARSQANAARSYYQQESEYEQDYYKSRVKAAASYNLEVRRAEEDHQREMLRLAQEHDDRMADLADKRDALGMLREMRDYERQRQAAESDYQVEASRRSQDFARQIADMEQQFAEARARRLADYQQQRADAEEEYNYRAQQRAAQMAAELKKADADHKTEMEALAAQEKDKLNQLAKQYADERAARYTALANQLRDLNAYMGAETELRQQYYAAWTAQFQNFMNANLSLLMGKSYTPPAKAAGGYTSGLVMTGEEGLEWILDNPTTRLAEKLVGGKLTQNKMVSLLVGGAGGGETHITFNQRNDGRITARDREWLRNDIRDMVLQAFK